MKLTALLTMLFLASTAVACANGPYKTGSICPSNCGGAQRCGDANHVVSLGTFASSNLRITGDGHADLKLQIRCEGGKWKAIKACSLWRSLLEPDGALPHLPFVETAHCPLTSTPTPSKSLCTEIPVNFVANCLSESLSLPHHLATRQHYCPTTMTDTSSDTAYLSDADSFVSSSDSELVHDRTRGDRGKRSPSTKAPFRTSSRQPRPPVQCKALLGSHKVTSYDIRSDLRRSAQRTGIIVHPDSPQNTLPTDREDDGEVDSYASECESTMAEETNSDLVAVKGKDKSSRGNTDFGSLLNYFESLTIRDSQEGKDCSFCRLTTHYIRRSWETLQTLRSRAIAGWECCNLIVDAVTTWYDHCKLSVSAGSLYSVDTAKISLDFQQLSYKNGPGPKWSKPRIYLRWDFHDGVEQIAKKTLLLFKTRESESDPDPLSQDIASRYSFPFRPLPSAHTASSQAFACLNQWIEACSRSHLSCSKSKDQNYAPKRVLEIKDGKVFLREHLAPGIRYACLSHCWGPQGVAIKLNRHTLDTFKCGYNSLELPKTFQDAVQVCERLNIPNLWIDALCILQDSSEDWAEAAATMADIYENAVLTIAATKSKDSNGGLFSDPNSPFRPRKLKNSFLYIAEWHIQDYCVNNNRLYWNFGYWPLLERAWVYQERHLSPRIVQFTDTQLLLWAGNSNGDMPFKHYDGHGRKDTWHRMVEDYSSLQLTLAQDRLPALAAIVQHKFRRRSTTDAPTWSWASVSGVPVSAIGPPQLGKVKDAALLLEARSSSGLLNRNGIVELDNGPTGLLRYAVFWHLFLDVDYATIMESTEPHGGVHVVYIGWKGGNGDNELHQWLGLALQQVSENSYRRIGLCWMADKSYYSRRRRRRVETLQESFEWRYQRHFIESLPIRRFRII
ncbi:hypothetical protein OPT61_g4331 [Boeremia exigua]|uniref:Uncharacterized protein n=1 Tax=Boeremia exigua TaxID=749465 RepID=A0ACC2IEN5_9PLEO|nr:hypothetical protein OPT61_g4331 [Boeremia exigua]